MKPRMTPSGVTSARRLSASPAAAPIPEETGQPI